MDSGQNLRQVELLQALEATKIALRSFSIYVERQAESVWLAEPPAPPERASELADFGELANRTAALGAVADIIRAIDYVDGQDPRTTRKLVGVISLPREGLAAALEINTLRERVARAWKAVAEDELAVLDDVTGEGIQVSLRKDVLRRSGRARLNQRQTVRRFLVFEHPLESVSFFWNGSPNITATTCEKLREDLARPRYQDSPHLAADLALLSVLPPQEPFAIFTHVKPRVCANIRWSENGKVKVKSNVKTSMPIFVPAPGLPIVKKPQPRTERKKRVDVKIQPEPYLTLIAAHRYENPAEALRLREQRALLRNSVEEDSDDTGV